MTAQTGRSIASLIVRDFAAEVPKTRSLLAVAPESQFDWKPHEKSMTLCQLVAHLAEAPTWVPSMLDGDEMDFADIEDSYQPFAPSSHAELMEGFEKNVKDFMVAMEGHSDDFMLRDWTMRKGDQVLMKQPREAVIREILIHHCAHHRGQLTVYLRLLGIPVPSTHGPTADDPTF